jgi:acetyl esterase/lipase
MYRLLILLFIFGSQISTAQDTATYTSQEIVYGRKDGLAMTMVVLTPKKSNQRGVISLMSGNWVSGFRNLQRSTSGAHTFLKRGYTVFLVAHGSQPRYNIQDAAGDVKRAVQFVRYNAKTYNISPDYIGITGSSSGGHLSLLAGLSDNSGNKTSKDPVEQVSGKVQAVACFFPPTDFLNWGAVGISPANQRGFLQLMRVLGAFQFTRFDSAKNIYTEITDTAQIMRIARELSPAHLVTPDDAPVFIWHGDADRVVPLQQSLVLKEKMEATRVPFSMKIKPKADHGWPDATKDQEDFANWFDQHLKPVK